MFTLNLQRKDMTKQRDMSAVSTISVTSTCVLFYALYKKSQLVNYVVPVPTYYEAVRLQLHNSNPSSNHELCDHFN